MLFIVGQDHLTSFVTIVTSYSITNLTNWYASVK